MKVYYVPSLKTDLLSQQEKSRIFTVFEDTK